MKRWLQLSAAITSEVSATLALRAATDGTPAWYALVVAGYVASLLLLSRLLRQGASVSVLYGIWAACGVALTAVLAVVLFDEALTVVMAIGIVFVVAGVLLTETASQRAAGTTSG